ncbi:MAG: hypothetical protein NTX24_01045 [Candidatus Pacearchaeota archaeon]|nr:hypothetical protein [Candidatus Pacearchaeota archaeon]
MLNDVLSIGDENKVAFYGSSVARKGISQHGAYDCVASVPAPLITKAIQIHRPDLEERLNLKGKILTGIDHPYFFSPDCPERGFLFVHILAGDCISACVFGTDEDVREYHPDEIKQSIEREKEMVPFTIKRGGEDAERARAYLDELNQGIWHLPAVQFSSGNTYGLEQQKAARKLFVLWLRTLRGIKKYAC